MASFPKMTTTSAGQRLLTKAMAGAALQFTKIVLGDGQLNGVSISTLTALISQKAYCDITFEKSTGTTYQVGGLLLPENITTGFYWREVGLIALDPDDSSEVLFSYSNDGTATDYIDPNVTDSRFEKNIYISTGISTASSVTVEIPSTDTCALQDLSNVPAEVIAAAVENSGIAFETPIKEASSKTTPVDADSAPLVDSADGSKTKLVLWSNIKAALKTAFDSIYAAATHTHAWSTITEKPTSFMPSAHAASHNTGGSDALTAVDIGAAAATHAHGNLTSDGKISDVPLDATLVQLVSGALQTLGGTAIDRVKIATGSYTGTGTYGSSNPNSLTFDFIPKFVVISQRATATDLRGFSCPYYKLSFLWNQPYESMWIGYSSAYVVNLSFDANTVNWYSTTSSSAQGNYSGLIYDYIVFG